MRGTLSLGTEPDIASVSLPAASSSEGTAARALWTPAPRPRLRRQATEPPASADWLSGLRGGPQRLAPPNRTETLEQALHRFRVLAHRKRGRGSAPRRAAALGGHGVPQKVWRLIARFAAAAAADACFEQQLDGVGMTIEAGKV